MKERLGRAPAACCRQWRGPASALLVCCSMVLAMAGGGGLVQAFAAAPDPQPAPRAMQPVRLWPADAPASASPGVLRNTPGQESQAGSSVPAGALLAVSKSATDQPSSRSASRQPASGSAARKPTAKPATDRPAAGHRIDRSGKKRAGKASYYAKKFAGRKMADGTRMDPQDDNAASKTLPLGTRARVTNKETGRSTEVTIQDRGPYVKDRIVDLSPKKAQEIGITQKDGVAEVEVQPLALPPRSEGGDAGAPNAR